MRGIARWAREWRRSRAVARLGMLRTQPEPAFDRIVNDAARAFDAPVALLSLIHADQQWFKAAHGWNVTSGKRGASICQHVLDTPGILELCAPDRDPRFRDLPHVTAEGGVRYYIGAPVTDSRGVDVGALCVVDFRAHGSASNDQRAYLLALARRAGRSLESRVTGFGDGAP